MCKINDDLCEPIIWVKGGHNDPFDLHLLDDFLSKLERTSAILAQTSQDDAIDAVYGGCCCFCNP